MIDAVLFAGPSACGIPSVRFERAGVELRPPVRRGDIDRLLGEPGPRATVVVCDGAFQSVPAVSHAELCRALDAGRTVWGVSSLGAIRAFELRGEGMRGFGEVYAMFERIGDFADDEMCLLHSAESPYFPLSEALVNVRHALARRGRSLGITDASAAAVIERLRRLWFGDRTQGCVRRILVDELGIGASAADALLSWITRHPVKTRDLERLLRARPWRDSTAPARRP